MAKTVQHLEIDLLVRGSNQINEEKAQVKTVLNILSFPLKHFAGEHPKPQAIHFGAATNLVLTFHGTPGGVKCACALTYFPNCSTNAFILFLLETEDGAPKVCGAEAVPAFYMGELCLLLPKIVERVLELNPATTSDYLQCYRKAAERASVAAS